MWCTVFNNHAMVMKHNSKATMLLSRLLDVLTANKKEHLALKTLNNLGCVYHKAGRLQSAELSFNAAASYSDI